MNRSILLFIYYNRFLLFRIYHKQVGNENNLCLSIHDVPLHPTGLLLSLTFLLWIIRIEYVFRLNHEQFFRPVAKQPKWILAKCQYRIVLHSPNIYSINTNFVSPYLNFAKIVRWKAGALYMGLGVLRSHTNQTNARILRHSLGQTFVSAYSRLCACACACMSECMLSFFTPLELYR